MSGIFYKNRPYAGGGGGAGGASALSDLTDISISSPTNGQVLKYNNGFWENDDESGGTTVVANPQGEASTQLNKLQVGNDIYSIPSGGGGGASDDYSTTEQTIGSWIDGKPIYKKSFEINVQLNDAGWSDTGCAVSDLKNIINIEIVGIDRYVSGAPANIGHLCAVRYYNNNVQVYLNLTWQVTLQTLTLKYTKTTD